jgi:hypothetical protein
MSQTQTQSPCCTFTCCGVTVHFPQGCCDTTCCTPACCQPGGLDKGAAPHQPDQNQG